MNVFIDENLAQDDTGSVTCRHRTTVLEVVADPVRDAQVRVTAPQTAGPSVRTAASHFADREVVLRQTFCPECLTLLQSDIVPADEPSSRSRPVKVVGA